MTDDLQIALAIYDARWSYYRRTTELSARLFDWYFKLAALPAVAGIVAANRGCGFSGPTLAAVLAAIFAAGLCLVVAHGKVVRNSFPYYDHASRIESFLVGTSEMLRREVGTLTELRGLRGEATGETRGGSILIWRLLAVAAVNSAVGGLAVSLLGRASGPVIAVAIASIVVHVCAYRLAQGPLLPKVESRLGM